MIRRITLSRFAVLMLLVEFALASAVHAQSAATADPTAEAQEMIIPQAALHLPLASRRNRSQFSVNPIEAMLLRAGSQPLALSAGDAVIDAAGKTTSWELIELNESGGIDREGKRQPTGYLVVPINSDREQIMVLHAAGSAMTYFNGEPRGSDVYGKGRAHLPVLLRQGKNELVMRLSGRGRVRTRLYAPPQPVFLVGADNTLPDLVLEESTNTWGAVVAVNATRETVLGLSVETSGDHLSTTTTEVPPVPPLSMRKIPIRLVGSSPHEPGNTTVTARLYSSAGAHPESKLEFELRIRSPEQALRQTFVSELDGSVQYYALRRATGSGEENPKPSIVLSCHGASVQAIRHASSYASKPWLHLVAPNNRRPFGFDWEDFGRADALEVLDIAKQQLQHDPARIYLTGHSMGGHGTWHLGATFPDRFAAIGPSAGWISYKSYAQSGADPAELSPVDEVMGRGANAGDTLGLLPNLKQQGVYILHGGGDNNVPPSQARTMADALKEFHHDWFYHEEPDKGHWWNHDSHDGGVACLDWPPMFDMFARHVIPPAHTVREVDFVTVNPGVSSHCHWLSIEAQRKHHAFSRATIMTWPGARRFRGTTENIAVLQLNTRHFRSEGPISVELDGHTLDDIPQPRSQGSLWLERTGDTWAAIQQPDLKTKGPHRYGSIKSELKHRFVLVYGTQGNAAEIACCFAKARFDAETYWYRGNASVDLMSDAQFDPAAYPDRTIVMYGNRDLNSDWNELLDSSPVQVANGSIQVGAQSLEGEDLAAVFIRPRPDSTVASVVAVAGTGEAGMRTCHPVSFFVPFLRYPDLVVLKGVTEEGMTPRILVAGYFDRNWSLEQAEIVWNSF